MACSEWKVPFLPVKPWQMTFVLRSMRMDIGSSLRAVYGIDDLLRGVVEIVGRDHVQPRLVDDLLALIDVGAFQPHHERHLEPDLPHGRHYALRDHVAAHDAAEDVDQDAL